MASGLNKIFIIGNLVRDPELRTLPNGTPKAEMRMASSRSYTTGGEKREDTCFVDVVAWTKTAEVCAQYLKKGSKILVEGRLDYREWEKDGQKRSKHEIVADSVQFLDSRGKNEDDEGGSRETTTRREAPAEQPAAPVITDEDVPFNHGALLRA